MVPRIDRLARNLTEGLRAIEELHAQGIYIRSLAKGLDTGDGSPTARLMLHMLLSWPSGRGTPSGTGSGPAWTAPAAEGRIGGRPSALSPEKVEAVRDFLKNHGSVSAAARTFGVSRPTMRAVRDGIYGG